MWFDPTHLNPGLRSPLGFMNPFNAQINWGNPLTKDLRVFFFLGYMGNSWAGINLVDHKIWISNDETPVTAGVLGANQYGPYLVGDGNINNHNYVLMEITPPTFPFTLAARGLPYESPTSDDDILLSLGTDANATDYFALRQESGGDWSIIQFTGTLSGQASAGNVSGLYISDLIIGTFRDNSYRYGSVNGVVGTADTTTVTAVPANWSRLTFGATGDLTPSREFWGGMQYAALWDRELTVEEHMSFYLNPNQMVKAR